MRLPSVFLAVGLVAAIAGCAAAIDPRRAAILKDEIATLASVAALDGTRAPAERRAILGFGEAVVRHVDELADR